MNAFFLVFVAGWFGLSMVPTRAAPIFDEAGSAHSPVVPILRSPDEQAAVSATTASHSDWQSAGSPPPPTKVLVFSRQGFIPLVVTADDAGASYAAWSGSSRYVFLVSGLHSVQSLDVIYSNGLKLALQSVAFEPILAYGRRYLPAGHDLDHDEILEVKSGEGDSIRCLYWRTGGEDQNFAVPIRITFVQSGKSIRCSFSFGTRMWATDNEGPDDMLARWK